MHNNEWYKNIKKHLRNLPGEVAHIEMIPYRLPSSSFNFDEKKPKLSAVMCLLFQKNNETFCILMERTKDGGKHSGQISFPGGKKENNDSNLEHTALRETYEEIGIHSNLVTVLGELTQVYIPISNFLIQPFLGVIHSDFEFNLSVKEVESIVVFKLSDLINSSNKQLKDIKNHKGFTMKNIPCFILERRIVWGATSLILNELKIILEKTKGD